MRTILVVVVVAVVLVGAAIMVQGRAGAGSPEPVAAKSAVAPVAAPALAAGDAAGVTAGSAAAAVKAAVQAVDALDRASPNTKFGVAVLDRTTGQLAVGAGGATAFYSASVVKLYTVVAILHRVETGSVTLTAADRTNIQRALMASDDQAMDALWEKFGGAQTVAQTISLVGLKDSEPPDDTSEWGETLISARDVVAVYDYVLRSMAPSSRDMIMGALEQAQDTGADGFDQAFGLIAPPRKPDVAAKQGWMWIGSDFWLHSTGVLGADDRYVIAVLSKNTQPSAAAARTIVTTATSDAEAALPGPW